VRYFQRSRRDSPARPPILPPYRDPRCVYLARSGYLAQLAGTIIKPGGAAESGGSRQPSSRQLGSRDEDSSGGSGGSQEEEADGSAGLERQREGSRSGADRLATEVGTGL
jgi:hypothetical protein